jgi:hypothetical protein
MGAESVAAGSVYYSFDYGMAHFVVYDSNITTNAAQFEWLEADLKATKQPWIVVMTHQGIFRWPQDGLGPVSNRESLHQLFRDNRVNLVIQGHRHLYSRCSMGGVMYLSIPSAAFVMTDVYLWDNTPETIGANTYTPAYGSIARAKSFYGTVLLDIQERSIDIEAHSHYNPTTHVGQDKIVDGFRLLRRAGSPIPSRVERLYLPEPIPHPV